MLPKEKTCLVNGRSNAGVPYKLGGTRDNTEPPAFASVPNPLELEGFQMLGTILIVVLLLLLLGAWPSWPHSRSWGYYPSGTLGLVLVIVLVLALVGRI
jgi:hypothetical protein